MIYEQFIKETGEVSGFRDGAFFIKYKQLVTDIQSSGMPPDGCIFY